MNKKQKNNGKCIKKHKFEKKTDECLSNESLYIPEAQRQESRGRKPSRSLSKYQKKMKKAIKGQ